VRALIEQLRAKELPDEIPEPVYYELIDKSTKQWEPLCVKWFDELQAMSMFFIRSLLDNHFAVYQATGLQHEAK
jgi:hypothetical protein